MSHVEPLGLRRLAELIRLEPQRRGRPRRVVRPRVIEAPRYPGDRRVWLLQCREDPEEEPSRETAAKRRWARRTARGRREPLPTNLEYFNEAGPAISRTVQPGEWLFFLFDDDSLEGPFRCWGAPDLGSGFLRRRYSLAFLRTKGEGRPLGEPEFRQLLRAAGLPADKKRAARLLSQRGVQPIRGLTNARMVGKIAGLTNRQMRS